MNKLAKLYKKYFPLLNILAVLVDVGLLVYLSGCYDETIPHLICIAGVIFILYRLFKACLMVSRSKGQLLTYALNNRVIAVKGKQRVGKSSFVCYACSVLGGNIFSNIPFKIKGKFTHKLTSEILSLRESVPEYSTLCIDECNLFYNNLRTKQGSQLIFGQAALEQCVGHFTDGNIFYSATDVDRLPKEIRDNFSCKLQMLEQRTYDFSFLGSFILKIIGKSLGFKRIYTGVRIWHAQHFEKLNEEGYVYDLSGNEEGQGFKYANLYTFATFQSINSFEYDDRYMKSFYDQLPAAAKEKWKSFRISVDEFDYLYDSEIVKFFKNIIEEQEYNQRLTEGEKQEVTVHLEVSEHADPE